MILYNSKTRWDSVAFDSTLVLILIMHMRTGYPNETWIFDRYIADWGYSTNNRQKYNYIWAAQCPALGYGDINIHEKFENHVVFYTVDRLKSNS